MKKNTQLHHCFAFLSALITLGMVTNVWAEWHKSEQAIMGTSVVVDIWHNEQNIANQCSKQVFDEMERINQAMHPSYNDSELFHINQQAADHEIKISDEIYQLIDKSLEISRASDGAFDITFASVGYLYDYRNRIHPTEKNIKNNLPAINYQHIKLNPDNKTIKFNNKNVRLDFGGIAKGYAVDNAISILKKCGIKSGMVSAGGDSRVLGDRNGEPWVVGVQHPRQKNKVVVRLPLSNSAISTSGDYERFFFDDGKRYHHIINPATGTPAENTWSATVIGNDATTTDALSTTLFILGAEKAIELIETYEGIDAVIIDDKGKMHYSSGLMPPEKQHSAQRH
jgi:thiamine biosynthesis lipoprotein